MKIKRFVEQPVEITITGVTLLSTEEAGQLSVDQLAKGDTWWLRSPGGITCFAACIADDGTVRSGMEAEGVDFFCGVRPVFIFQNHAASGIPIGDRLWVDGISATVISDTMALVDDIIDYVPFRSNSLAPDANDYEKSDVRKWLGYWWKELQDREA